MKRRASSSLRFVRFLADSGGEFIPGERPALPLWLRAIAFGLLFGYLLGRGGSEAACAALAAGAPVCVGSRTRFA